MKKYPALILPAWGQRGHLLKIVGNKRIKGRSDGGLAARGQFGENA